MTKREAYYHFFRVLSEEEREAGPERMPDFVEHMTNNTATLTEKQVKWAKAMTAKV